MTIYLQPDRWALLGEKLGESLGQAYADRYNQKQYSKAVQDIIGMKNEQADLSKPNAALNKATFEIANDPKYASSLDAMYPSDVEGKALNGFLSGAEDLANKKTIYEQYLPQEGQTDGWAGYRAKIAAEAENIRRSIAPAAQQYGLNIGSDVSASAFQKAVDELKTKYSGQNMTPAIDMSAMHSDIDQRSAEIEQRRRQLGLDGGPSAKRAAIIKQLAKYSPRAMAAGLQFYDNSLVEDKQQQRDSLIQRATGSLIQDLYGAKTPEQKANVLMTYGALTGAKFDDLVAAYKAHEDSKKGQFQTVTTDLGNVTLQSGFDTHSGRYTNPTLFPIGLAPEDALKAEVDRSNNINDNETKIAVATINGDYSLRRSGISYEQALAVAQMSKDNKLNAVDKVIVDTVSSAITDPDRWEQLKSTPLGQQYLQRYRQIAGIGSGKITDSDYDKMYNYYVNSGLQPEEAHKLIQKAFW